MVPLLILALAAAGGDASGGGKGSGDDFCADRPGLATGTCIVPGGHVQLEFSLGEYSRMHNSDGTERDWSWAPFELRIGLDQKTEFNLAMEPALRSKLTSGGTTERQRGVGDLTLGFKRRLSGDDAKVSATVLPFVTLPTGSAAFTAGKPAEGVLVSLNTTIKGPWSATLTPELDRNPNSGGDGYHLREAVAGEIGLDVTEKLNLGLDLLVARERDGADHKREAELGLAAAYQVGKNLQLDTEVRTGFARSSPDLTLISGVAVRF